MMEVSSQSTAWWSQEHIAARLRGASRLVPILVLLGVWQLSVEFNLVDRTFLPSFGSTLQALWELLRDGEIGINLLVTMYRALGGLEIGTSLGVTIGLMMAVSRQADRFFGPLVAMTYSLPKTSLIPLFMLWFGIGDVTNILSVVLACLLPVIVSTYHGVRAVPQVMVWSAQSMGTPRHLILWRVLLPNSMMSILPGVRIALGFCFVLTISAEMIAAKLGIGKLIFLYGENGAYAHMFGALLVVVLTAYALDRAFLRMMHHVLRWHDSIHAAHANG